MAVVKQDVVVLVVVCGSWIPRGRGLREGRLVRSVGRKVPPKPSNLRIDTIQTPSTELGCLTSASEVGRTPKQFGHIHRRSKKNASTCPLAPAAEI